MWAWFCFALALVIASVVYLIRRLSASTVTLDTKVVVCLGWGVSLFVLALVPLDVVVTMTNADRRKLSILYAIPYWSTQVLTWLLLPLYQLYTDAGDFTVRERLRTSVKENAMFYAVLAVLGVVVVLGLVITKGITVSAFAGAAVAFSLSFSVATGVLLMGYGFSEIPRTCWLRSSVATRQQWCEHQVGKLSGKLEEAHNELAKVVWSVDQMSNTMPRRHHLRWAMEVIDESIKKSAVAGVSPDSEDRDDEEYDYEDIHALASLRRRLNRALIAFDRVKHEYMQAVADAVEVGDIVGCLTSGETKFRSSLRPPRTGRHAELKDKVEYQWKCIYRRYMLRFLAVLFAFTSFILVLAEITIWLVHVPSLQHKDLSIVSLIIESDGGTDLPTKVIVGLVLMYMLACAYFTVLKLAMFSFFHVVPGHTDAMSLCLSGTLFCRYSSPLCYNFLSLLPIVHRNGTQSVFEHVMGSHLPQAAVLFNDIFPVVLGVFCPMVTFGVLDRMKGCCSKSRFSINDEGIADETTSKGRSILEREKESIRNGGRPGETHSAFTMRRREPKKKSGLELNRFFGRGKKEGAEDGAVREEQRTSLIVAEREERAGPPMTRAEELKARLNAKVEAVRAGASGGAPAAVPPPAARPVSTQAEARPPPAPAARTEAPKADAGSLDSFFASLKR